MCGCAAPAARPCRYDPPPSPPADHEHAALTILAREIYMPSAWQHHGTRMCARPASYLSSPFMSHGSRQAELGLLPAGRVWEHLAVPHKGGGGWLLLPLPQHQVLPAQQACSAVSTLFLLLCGLLLPSLALLYSEVGPTGLAWPLPFQGVMRRRF